MSESVFVGHTPSLEFSVNLIRRAARSLWIHIPLFALTVITTTVFGYAIAESFGRGQALDFENLWQGYRDLFRGDVRVWKGLEFSGPLLLILLAHEFGHSLECVKWRVDASLPYFLPSPTLLGTLGAFIRIRSPIYLRSALFDIGISGPLAGFVVLVPFLLYGVWNSHVQAAGPHQAFEFGTPILMRLIERLRFPGVPASHIILHPAAMAAWGGLLATAFNLLPLGQLDGGHIVYSLGGTRVHRRVSTVVVVILALLGFFYWAWWIWAALMFILGRRHALVYDDTPLSRGRLVLSVSVLLILLLSISVVPVRIL